jgi:hypothetical protein
MPQCSSAQNNNIEDFDNKLIYHQWYAEHFRLIVSSVTFTVRCCVVSTHYDYFYLFIEPVLLWRYSFSPMRHRSQNKCALQLHYNRPRQSKLIPDFDFQRSCSFKMIIHPNTKRTHNVTSVIERPQRGTVSPAVLQDVTHPSTDRAQCCLT